MAGVPDGNGAVSNRSEKRSRGPGRRVWLLDEGCRRQVVHRLDGPSHAEMSPRWDDVPAAWRDAPAFHLAPMPLPVQRELLAALAGSPATISLDPYELLRDDDLRAADSFLEEK